MTKWCKYCNSEHALTKEFWNFASSGQITCKKRRKDKYRSDPEKFKQKAAQYRKDHPDYMSGYNLLKYWPGTREDALKQYKNYLASQNNLCAICGQPEISARYRLNVDHDHITGKIRGLLCSLCNRGLGNFRDNPELLEQAIRYLQLTDSASAVPEK